MTRDGLIARVRELEQQNAVQRENVDEAMRIAERLTADLAKEREAYDALRRIADAMGATNTRLEKERKGLRDELDILREEHEEAMARGAALVAENTRLSSRVALLEGRLRAAKFHECMRCGQFACPMSGPSATGGCSALYNVLPPLNPDVHRCAPASDNVPFRQPNWPERGE